MLETKGEIYEGPLLLMGGAPFLITSPPLVGTLKASYKIKETPQVFWLVKHVNAKDNTTTVLFLAIHLSNTGLFQIN